MRSDKMFISVVFLIIFMFLACFGFALKDTLNSIETSQVENSETNSGSIEPFIVSPSVTHFLTRDDSVPIVFEDNIVKVVNLGEASVDYLVVEYFDGFAWQLIGTDYYGGFDGTDGDLEITNFTSGWSVAWDPAGLEEGIVQVRATMHGTTGETATTVRYVFYDPTPPKVVIDGPQGYLESQGFVLGDINFIAHSDDEDIVSIYVDLIEGSNVSYTQAGEFGDAEQHDVGPSTSTGRNNFCAPTAAANAMWRIPALRGNFTNATELAKNLSKDMNTTSWNGTGWGDIKKGLDAQLAKQGLGCNNSNGFKVSCVCSSSTKFKYNLNECATSSSLYMLEDYNKFLRENEAIIIARQRPGPYGGSPHAVTGHDSNISENYEWSYLDPDQSTNPNPEGGWKEPEYAFKPRCFWAISPKNTSNVSAYSFYNRVIEQPCTTTTCEGNYSSNGSNGSVGLSDGFHTFVVGLVDSEGNRGEDRLFLYVNNNEPVPEILTPPPGSNMGNTVHIVVEDSLGSEDIKTIILEYMDPAGLWYPIYTLDHSGRYFEYDWDTVGLVNGDYTLRATMIDYAGGMQSYEVLLKLDRFDVGIEYIDIKSNYDIYDPGYNVAVRNYGGSPVDVLIESWFSYSTDEPAVVFSEGFEDAAVFPPTGWHTEHYGNVVEWQQHSPGYPGVGYDAGIHHDIAENIVLDEWLITDSYDMSRMSDLYMSFWFSTLSAMPCTMEIYASTDGGETMEEMRIPENIIDVVALAPESEWTLHTIPSENLASLYGEPDVRFAFSVQGAGFGPVNIDVDDIVCGGTNATTNNQSGNRSLPQLQPGEFVPDSFFDIFTEIEIPGNGSAGALIRTNRSNSSGEKSAILLKAEPGWEDDDDLTNNEMIVQFEFVDDTTPPDILFYDHSIREYSTVTFSANVVDNVGVEYVSVHVTGPESFDADLTGSGDYYDYQHTFLADGHYDYYISATDGKGYESATPMQGFDILTNKAPVIYPYQYISAYEGEVIAIDLEAQDANMDAFWFTTDAETELPSEFVWEFAEGFLLWTPGYYDAGVYTLTFHAEDGLLTSDPMQVQITVNDNPQSPVLQNFSSITVNEMGTVYVRPIASDADNETLNFSINSTLFTWDAIYNRFKWKTGPTSSGQYDFLVTVSDGEFEDSEVVHVTVNNKCTIFDKRNWCWVGCTCKFDVQAYAEPATAIS